MEKYLNETMIAMITSYATRVAGVLILLFVAWMIAGWIRKITNRGLTKAKFDATLTKFFSNFASYTVLILAVLACLGIFDVQIIGFAALIGAAGLAVGLAFQGTLSNLAAGVMLLTFRPFKVGDLVNIAGNLGIVNEIELFTTALDTLDNRRIIVPNSVIFGSTNENLTYHDVRRVDVSVGTEYPADIDSVRRVLEKAVEDDPGRLRTSLRWSSSPSLASRASTGSSASGAGPKNTGTSGSESRGRRSMPSMKSKSVSRSHKWMFISTRGSLTSGSSWGELGNLPGTGLRRILELEYRPG
jgi:small conductance mechanosensitive channel